MSKKFDENNGAQESIARQYETGITRFESWTPNLLSYSRFTVLL